MVEILKYKKMSNGRYKVFLDNGNELLLYEEVILRYELLLNKNIDSDMFNDIEKFNLECDVYYVALRTLKARFKSVKELRDSLVKKEYPADLIDKAISKLLKQGYLNDVNFCKSYINNQIITSSKGPKKIGRELSDKGIPREIIDVEMSAFSDSLQLEKIRKIANRMFKSNKNRGGVVLKRKIINDLITLGYDISLINNILDDFSFDNNNEIAKREYDKAYNKFSRKYSGKELEYKIKERLYKQGLYYEE